MSKDYHKSYYERNKERIKSKAKERMKNPEIRAKHVEYMREYYRKNKPTLLEKNKAYRKRPEIIAKQKTPEIKARRKEAKIRYANSPHGKLKIQAYNKYSNKKRKEFFKKRYEENREEIRAKQSAYAKSPEGRSRKRAYERRPERRAIKAEYTREYQAKPEVHQKRLEQSRKFKKTPKGKVLTQTHNQNRRARILNLKGSFTKTEWLQIRATTNGICPFCNKCVGLDKMSIDHIVPVSLGGSNDISNIRAICRSCNSKRGNRGYTYDIIDRKRVKIYG